MIDGIMGMHHKFVDDKMTGNIFMEFIQFYLLKYF